MRTIRTKVYQFSELSEQSKQTAIEQLYDINVNYEWYENVYYDFSQLCKTIDIDIDVKKTYFSGFSSQGDGAAFTADINLFELIKGINNAKYLEYAPKLETENNFSVNACSVDKSVLELIENLENWLEETLNELTSLFYKLHENDYDYLTSKEAIIETIEANEYEFKADGKQF